MSDGKKIIMKIKFNHIKWEVNDNHPSGMTPHQCIEACGIIPTFCNGQEPESLQQQCQDAYGFPFHSMSGGTVDLSTKIYAYPQDPDLEPYMSCTHALAETKETEHMLIYPYGITAFITTDKNNKVISQYITRMD